MSFAIDQTAAWEKKSFQESYIIKSNPVPFYLHFFLHLLIRIKHKS